MSVETCFESFDPRFEALLKEDLGSRNFAPDLSGQRGQFIFLKVIIYSGAIFPMTACCAGMTKKA